MSKRKSTEEINPRNRKVKKDDITIECNGVTFSVPSSSIDKSNVFKNLLQDCNNRTIIINENVGNFRIVLDIINNLNLNLITEDNYYDIYMMLDKYDIYEGTEYIEEMCVTTFDITDKSIDLVYNFSNMVDTLCHRYMCTNKIIGGDIKLVPDEFWLKCYGNIIMMKESNLTLSKESNLSFSFDSVNKKVLNNIKDDVIKKVFMEHYALTCVKNGAADFMRNMERLIGIRQMFF
jgi:hypothetical protein